MKQTHAQRTLCQPYLQQVINDHVGERASVGDNATATKGTERSQHGMVCDCMAGWLWFTPQQWHQLLLLLLLRPGRGRL